MSVRGPPAGGAVAMRSPAASPLRPGDPVLRYAACMAGDPLSAVHFQTTFEAPPGHDRARLLAEFLVARLTTFGVRCSQPREVGDAFTFRCAVGRRGFHVSVGEVDGRHGQC